MAAAHEHHIDATSEQRQQVTLARSNPSLRASQNHGRPPIAATSRPGSFSGAGVVGARQAGGPVHQNEAAHNTPAQRNAPVERRSAPVQHNEMPEQRAVQRNDAPRTEAAPRVENQPRPAPPQPAQHPAPHPEQHAPEHDDHDHH